MTSGWLRRPPFWQLGLFFVAYVLGCAFAEVLQIVPGSTVALWPPSGLFLAALILSPVRSWPWWVLAGCLAEMASQFLFFHTPLAPSLLIYAGNALEAMVGAWLVTWACGRPVRLETLRDVLTFAVLSAGVAPLISATVGSATLAWFEVEAQTFTEAWPLFWIGDATGILIVAPLALGVFQNWQGRANLSAARWVEICLLGLIFIGSAAFSLSGFLPFAYIVMPPLLWAAVRFEFEGAAATLILLALVTAVFTATGVSQFAGDPESQREKQIMLQLFLAISALSALIVAAISRQHQNALHTLRESVEAVRGRERELSQLVNMVPSHLWRLTPEGEPIFFNKLMADFLDMDVEDMDRPGTSRMDVLVEALHPDDQAAFKGSLDHCLATGERFSMRYRLRRADGVYHWMSSRADPLRDDDGRIIQWYGLCHDIDDEVRAQQALRARERELSLLVEMVPSQVWRLAPDGEATFYNKRLVDFLGLDIATMDKLGISPLAAAITAFVHPDDRANLTEAMNYSLANGERFSMRFRQRRADGVYRWLESRGEPMRDDSGVILEWYGTNVDIDDLVHAQDALRDRERELSQLVDMAPSLIWRFTPDGEPTFFNKRMVDFHDMAVADLEKPGMSRLDVVLETVHPDDVAEYRDALNYSLVTGESFSMRYRLRRADGTYRWMSGRAEPMQDRDGRIVQWVGLCHDIDDQTRLYSEVAEREAKIRRLIDSDIIGIVIWDLDGTLIDANDAFLRMVQYERTDVEAGLRWFDMTPSDWQDVHSHEEAEELATTGKMQPREKEFFRKDGRRVPVLIGAACFEGQSRQGVAYILDLTEQKHVESALRERERELSQLVETLPAMIDCATPDGEPIYRSQQFREFLGYELEELDTAGRSRLDGTLEAGVHPEDLAGAKETYAQALATGEPCARRFRMRRFDGEYRWVEARAAPIRNDEGVVVQWNVVCMDIDGEVRAEEELRLAREGVARASQAASLAELSASIAHEVNQPLAATVANSHACHRWLTADPPNLDRAKIAIGRIVRDANAAADVVSRIRALFRQAVQPRTPASLGSAILEAHTLMAEEAARHNIRMDIDIEPDLPLLEFDHVQVQQVLINLIRNGMDAMNLATDDRVLGMRVRRVGDLIQTEISDRGPGVDIPEKIFEPFFTTKQNGMGMGLSICRSIVESHNGRLWIEQNEPHGATFIFTLPIEEKASQ